MIKAPTDGPAAPRAGAGRWQRRKQERPGEILEAALELFVDRGYAATRLEEVALRAGVTKSTMYLYFESKEALFKAVVRAAVLPSLERAEHTLAEFVGSSRELLDSVLRQSWRSAEGSRASGLPKLMISEAAKFPELARFYHDEVEGRAHRLTAAVLRRGIESGEFRPLDVEYTARALRAPILLELIRKHSTIHSERETMDLERYLESAVDLLVHGVMAAPQWELPYV